MSASTSSSFKWSATNSSIVETSWLAEQLKNPNSKVKVFDASWTLQNGGQHAEFLQQRIPSAQFFDIDKIADTNTSLPHMLPTAAEFAQHMISLGVSNDDHIVIYDRSGSYVASARVWWTFKVFGHDQVSVLEGGLPKWLQDGYPVDSGSPDIKPSSSYTPSFNAWMVESLNQMLVNVQQKKQIADARPVGRFQGVDPEPRPNLRWGHMPGSKCVTWSTILQKQKQGDPFTVFLPPKELSQVFVDQGINPNEPVITTCGSGVTASVLSLGLHLLGNNKTSLYDGAWSEWGKESLEGTTPVE
eukprot:CAMPEP_0168552436 /NCGR_PEP_ID=MMETSP0413-20121227/6713_1 /TAXON_ID=136452 /ORGANISM="Filamoeba nolandi, Strain NC-AS-23-1" /LENGTH=300 /DNA_ID=CAMNT_0008583045 /DNA_START=187 /DNA_END=1086 /DNA_ORIENTATION=+